MRRAVPVLVLLAVLPAVGQDAGVPDYQPAIDREEYRCPDAEEEAVPLDGGWWVPDVRERRVTCLLASCAAHRDAIEAELGKSKGGSTTSVVVAALVGLVVGGAAGIVVWDRVVKK